MLLRSISRHVRDQNWTAIFIDFFIVVLGVYMGIEVSNWNERREDGLRAEAYLERFESDLQYNIDQLDMRITFWSAVASEGRVALAFAEQGELADDSAWATLRAFFHASQVWRFAFNDTTYSEMRSAGELSLIEAPGIREQLASYFVAVAPRRGEGMYLLLPDYREHVRSVIPSDISRYYWVHCHTQDLLLQTIHACDSPIDEARAARVLEQLMTTPGLADELRYWVDTLEVLTRLAEDDIMIAENLLVEVRKAKGN